MHTYTQKRTKAQLSKMHTAPSLDVAKPNAKPPDLAAVPSLTDAEKINNYPVVPKLEMYDVKDEKNKLPDGFFVICEGSRRVGKSVFLKYLLYHYRDKFDLAIVMSETPHNGFWQPMVSNQMVHTGWNPLLVEKLLSDQMTEREKEKHQHGYKPRKVLLILDDIVGDRNHIHEDQVLNRLAVQGRHYLISVCLTTQEPHAIGTSLRNNCDLVVIFQQKSERAKKSVCNDFLCKNIQEEWIARELLKNNTHNHDCIIVKMYELKPGVIESYYVLPESVSYDKEADKCKVPEYQLGSRDQKTLAKTKEGKLPLFK
jgi:hypothetical protein